MSGLSAIAYGSYIGIIVYREKAGRVWPGMLDTTKTKSLLRFLIHLFIAVPLAGVMFISLANWPIAV